MIHQYMKLSACQNDIETHQFMAGCHQNEVSIRAMSGGGAGRNFSVYI